MKGFDRHAPQPPHVRTAKESDDAAIVTLWQACDLTRPWNDPWLDLARRRTVSPGGLWVIDGRDAAAGLRGAVMAGYDGHRGSLNYLALAPSHRGQGLGRALVTHAVRWLQARGVPKLNLQVREGNEAALAFYGRLGFVEDAVSCLSLRLVED
jgi:ribosomal protein S18 acetylase RimI-like enzyme